MCHDVIVHSVSVTRDVGNVLYTCYFSLADATMIVTLSLSLAGAVQVCGRVYFAGLHR